LSEKTPTISAGKSDALAGIDKRHHVGAAAGDEYDGAFARRGHMASVPW
jgi:hypothetical protein